MVSVVVPTFNSEKTIELCLKSVKAQTYKEIEIVVVDNYSRDETVRIAKKYAKNVHSCGGERSRQRNFGIRKAKGDFIFYLDSDMTLDRGVVSECVSTIKKKVALYIPEIIEGDNFLTKVLNFERTFYNETVIDATRFVRKDALLKAGLFDENLIACEDWDLDRRLSKFGKFGSITSPLYHLQYGLTLKKMLAKKFYYSKFVKRYIEKCGRDATVRKQFGFRYRYFQVFLENGKWKKLIRNPIYALCMLGLKVIVGAVYLYFINSERFSSRGGQENRSLQQKV